eukprot:3172687-Rhodomonas_salina.1
MVEGLESRSTGEKREASSEQRAARRESGFGDTFHTGPRWVTKGWWAGTDELGRPAQGRVRVQLEFFPLDGCLTSVQRYLERLRVEGWGLIRDASVKKQVRSGLSLAIMSLSFSKACCCCGAFACALGTQSMAKRLRLPVCSVAAPLDVPVPWS